MFSAACWRAQKLSRTADFHEWADVGSMPCLIRAHFGVEISESQNIGSMPSRLCAKNGVENSESQDIGSMPSRLRAKTGVEIGSLKVFRQ